MERWAGRVAVVTGASAGIGASIAEELVKKGLKVVGLARRVEKIELYFCSLDGPIEQQRSMLELNVLALNLCTQEALKSMKENGVDDGHIIHINSDCGHKPPGGMYAMYCATKHAVTALAEGLRQELIKQNSRIRVTSVSPGLVKTEMPAEMFFKTMPALEPSDIADAVLYVRGVPNRVQVSSM
ncbi:Dehydrogenase/reductase SDR family member 11 [Blattella germanica]|nr:Dehydrogenase/reductase SDR family member 11 [Blattella germanica]